jgi:hypothetical protein
LIHTHFSTNITGIFETDHICSQRLLPRVALRGQFFQPHAEMMKVVLTTKDVAFVR